MSETIVAYYRYPQSPHFTRIGLQGPRNVYKVFKFKNPTSLSQKVEWMTPIDRKAF